MRHRFAAVVASAVVVLAIVGCGPGRRWPRPLPGHDTGAVLPVGPLHPDGRWIKDATSRTVIVHGLEVAHKTTPYRPPASSFGERDAEAISSWGFDAVRLAWFWKGLEPERGQIDAGYLAELDRIGDLLARHDVFTLLEAHQDGYNERLGGAGFPDWATVGEPPPNPNGLLGEATWAAFEHLYANDAGLADAFAYAWRQVATVFADNPKMLGYDLINEPGAGTASAGCLALERGCPTFDRATLQPFQDRAAAAIRTVDPTTIAFYEPNIFHDVGARSRLQAPPASSGPSGFAFHAYCINRFLNPLVDHESQAPGYASCAQSDATTFSHAIATADDMDVPPLFAEFGDTQDLDDITRMIDLADEHLTGWIYWAYKDWDDNPGGQGSGGLFDDSDHDGTLRADELATLSRPYAVATAGTPLSSHYDRLQQVFEYAFAPDHTISAPTVLFTSPVNNPRGYRVEVQGARVVSAPNATYLRLQPTRDADHVFVRLVGRRGGASTIGRGLGIVPIASASGPVPVASMSPVAVSHTCAPNVGAPDHLELPSVAVPGRRLIGRLEADGGRGSVIAPDAVSVAFAGGDVAWFDLGAPTAGTAPALDLLCRAGGRSTVAVGPAPTLPTTFVGRSTQSTNVATANSRLTFEVPRPGHYVVDVALAAGSVRLGLRRSDGTMPTAALLTSAATVDLGVLGRGPASLDVVAVPGTPADWTVTIRPAR